MPTHTWGSCRIVDNAIPATAFKVLKASRKPGEREENETDKGLRVQDKGFLNTAVMNSTITYIDGEAGGAFPQLSFAHFILRAYTTPVPVYSASLPVCGLGFGCIHTSVSHETDGTLNVYLIQRLSH